MNGLVGKDAADVLGKVATRAAFEAVTDGTVHPEDIAYRIQFAVAGAVIALDVLTEANR